MSSQPYSLALETEENGVDTQMEVPLALLISKRFISETDAPKCNLSLDEVTLSGTITVSF